MDNKENGQRTAGESGKFDPKKYLLPVLMVILATLLIVAAVVFRDEVVSSGEGRDTRRSRTLYGYFDTVSTIYDYSEDTDAEFLERVATVEQTLAFYHGILDVYSDAEDAVGLYEINKNAGVAPVVVSEELIDFIEFSKEAYRLTGGEVNIAMGAVTKLWHECRITATYNPSLALLPDAAELAEAAKHCDIDKIIIDREASTVYLADGQMRIDAGAIGKGYATERAAQRLADMGAVGYALDIGGNLRVIGAKPSGKPFSTGIKNPNGESGYIHVIEVADSSAATSGGYERYYYVGDKRYHHIIDKDTLTSPDTFASVTVATVDAGLADALSTALFCMSYEEGRALADSLDGVKVIWVYHDGTVVESN